MATPEHDSRNNLSPDGRSVAVWLETLLGHRFLPGNEVTVLRNGVEIFPSMLEAIESARTSVELLTFIYWQGDVALRFAEALAAAAGRGVHVRVLLDSFGCAGMHTEARRLLEQSECRVRWFRPIQPLRLLRNDKRTHRKVLVCDNRVAFTGGVGIAEQWEGDARHPGEWRETHFRVEGPAAPGIRAGFFDNWLEADPDDIRCPEPVDAPAAAGDAEVLTLYSTANDFWSKIGSLFHVMFSAARESIRICTPYVVPDETSTRLLIEAMQRGVRLEILMPMKHLDNRITALAGRDHTRSLMRAGARVHHYNRTMMHAKVILIDGEFACVGSANFNQRSKRKDDELCLVIRDRGTIDTLARHFAEDLADPQTVPARPRPTLLRRLASRLVHPIREQT